MTAIAMKDLLEAGVHFGHQTKRWNPKMKEYIFGERNGIYIIDLGKTVKLFREAEEFVSQLAAEGGTILFVGTKRQAQDVDRRRSAALRHVLRQPALARRPADQLRDDPAQPRPAARPRGDGDRRPLRHALEEGNRAASRRRSASSQKNLEGIRSMARLPDAVFVVDTKKEKIAVDEARKLKIPVIGIVDTNCDPDEVDFVIPGNDDALRVDPAVRVAHRRRGASPAAACASRRDAEAARRERTPTTRPRAARRPARRAARPQPPAQPPRRRPSATPRSAPAGRTSRRFRIRAGRGLARGRRVSAYTTEKTSMAITAASGEEAPRPDRRGHDGVQGRADRGQRRLRRGDRPSCASAGSRRRPRRPAAPPTQGLIGNYIHMGGKIGVLVEVNCESDFVARTDDFQTLVKEIAMHIAAAEPAATSAARTCRPTCSRRRRRSTARRWRAPASRPTSSTRSSRASWAASTRRSCCSISRRSATRT